MTGWHLDLALALFGLAGGIGITAIGPGGVLPTIALFLLTPLSPAQVAGTAIVTHVATGVAGSAAYVHSGQLRERGTRKAALVMAGAAVLGTPLGVSLNTLVSPRWFGVVLGVFAVAVAVLVMVRRPVAHQEPPPAVIAALGLGVAIAAGLVGVGGPMLAVPLLVVAGAGMLEALAASQVQSVVIAGAGSLGYLVHGSIDWHLAVVIGVPELAGVVLGWKLARALPVRRLRLGLVVALLAVAPYLVLRG